MVRENNEKQRMIKKYSVHSGWVTSWVDGERHFISSGKLIKLYGVQPDECVIMRRAQVRVHGLAQNLKPLFPRHDGRYQSQGDKEREK